MVNYPKLDNSDIQHFIERDEPVLPVCIIGGGYNSDKGALRIYGVAKAPKLLNRNNDIFLLKKSHQIFGQEILKNMSDPAYIDGITCACHKVGKELQGIFRNIGMNTSRYQSSESLSDAFEQYYETGKDYCAFYMVAAFTSIMTDLAEEIANNNSSKGFSKERLFDIVTSPAVPTESDKEFDDFLEILSSYRDQRNVTKKVSDHIEKYSWIGVRYLQGRPWTREDVMQRISESKITDPATQLKERVQHRQEMDKEVERLKKQLSLKDIDTVRHIRDIVSLRTQRAEYLDKASVHILPLLSKIAQKIGVSYDDLLYLKPEEILRWLRERKGNRDEIVERKKDYLILPNSEDEKIVVTGQRLQKYIEKYPALDRAYRSIGQIRGNIAYKGKVQGKVRVVKSTRDLDKVKHGDVLVTVMTFPAFIAAMEKASAFVTDEGGILCHAAIVSREMKKPCIIATKDATRTLKDGDLVDVNADVGEVRILKRV